MKTNSWSLNQKSRKIFFSRKYSFFTVLIRFLKFLKFVSRYLKISEIFCENQKPFSSQILFGSLNQASSRRGQILWSVADCLHEKPESRKFRKSSVSIWPSKIVFKNEINMLGLDQNPISHVIFFWKNILEEQFYP